MRLRVQIPVPYICYHNRGAQWFSSVSPHNYQDSTISLHILSSEVFISNPTDLRYSLRLLAASLNKQPTAHRQKLFNFRYTDLVAVSVTNKRLAVYLLREFIQTLR